MNSELAEVQRIRSEKGCSLDTAKKCAKHAVLSEALRSVTTVEDLFPVVQEILNMLLPQEKDLK